MRKEKRGTEEKIRQALHKSGKRICTKSVDEANDMKEKNNREKRGKEGKEKREEGNRKTLTSSLGEDAKEKKGEKKG